jgi:hypothetical protein
MPEQENDLIRVESNRLSSLKSELKLFFLIKHTHSSKASGSANVPCPMAELEKH